MKKMNSKKSWGKKLATPLLVTTLAFGGFGATLIHPSAGTTKTVEIEDIQGNEVVNITEVIEMMGGTVTQGTDENGDYTLFIVNGKEILLHQQYCVAFVDGEMVTFGGETLKDFNIPNVYAPIHGYSDEVYVPASFLSNVLELKVTEKGVEVPVKEVVKEENVEIKEETKEETPASSNKDSSNNNNSDSNNKPSSNNSNSDSANNKPNSNNNNSDSKNKPSSNNNKPSSNNNNSDSKNKPSSNNSNSNSNDNKPSSNNNNSDSNNKPSSNNSNSNSNDKKPSSNNNDSNSNNKPNSNNNNNNNSGSVESKTWTLSEIQGMVGGISEWAYPYQDGNKVVIEIIRDINHNYESSGEAQEFVNNLVSQVTSKLSANGVKYSKNTGGSGFNYWVEIIIN